VGEWHNLNDDVRSRLGKKTVMVLARNQQPKPECIRCSQPSEAAYFRYYPGFGAPSTMHVICMLWSWLFVHTTAAAGRSNIV